MSFDHWKQTNPADRQLGRAKGPFKYACLDCAWTGAGMVPRAQHWKQTGHTVLYADDPRIVARREQDRQKAG